MEFNMLRDADLETVLQARGLNAPRLSPLMIDKAIVDTQYWRPENTTLTVCVLTLKNGTHVVGESACVSPENFDAKLGEEIAYNNAKQKVWGLEGYLLKEMIHRANNPELIY